MKNILLVFGILLLTTITVNGQDFFKKISLEKEWETKTITTEKSTELYDSIYQDFKNYFKNLTQDEEQEDQERNSIYDDIYNSFEMLNQVDEEKEEDTENENIYLELLIHLVKLI